MGATCRAAVAGPTAVMKSSSLVRTQAVLESESW